MFAQWRTVDGRPAGAATAGHADLEAAYPEMSAGGRFSVVAEVSAKREVTPAFLRKQMGQALKHGLRLREDAGGTVYALVVNGGRVATDAALQAEHRRFVEANGLRPDGPVRLVPICAIDLAGAVRRLEMDEPGQRPCHHAGRAGGGV